MKLMVLFILVVLSFVCGDDEIDNPSRNAKKLDGTASSVNNYKYAYAAESQKHNEQGQFVEHSKEKDDVLVKGSYSFTDADGIEYIVSYVADGRGYHPVINVNNPALNKS